MSIAIVTDSTCDLPPDLVAAHDITVIPLEVRLGGETYRDGLDLGTAELFCRVSAEGLRPITSQPSLGAFVRVYDELRQKFKSIISIHLSSSFSGTVDTAALARDSLPGADISVVDSGSFTLGLGLQVLAAARAVRAGLKKEAVLRLLEKISRRTCIFGVLEGLDFLRLGGRIGKVGHLLASLLKVRPLIRVMAGEAVSIGLSRRRAEAIESLLALVDRVMTAGEFHLGVMHTMAEKEAKELRRRLEERYGPVELLVEAGPVVGCHVGPGALGVAVMPA
ncbi:MAG: DegV family protein [Bacillota bacterium]